MRCKPRLPQPPTTALRHYRHRAAATSDHRGTARGFLPRALSNTRPQVFGRRCNVPVCGRVSNKPKQKGEFAGCGCNRSSRIFWRPSATTAVAVAGFLGGVIEGQVPKQTGRSSRNRPRAAMGREPHFAGENSSRSRRLKSAEYRKGQQYHETGQRASIAPSGLADCFAPDSVSSGCSHHRQQLFRVVGHLPGERIRASIRHELRAGVPQASREETAATATGGCSRH